jgi:hypothetical protein
VASNVFLQNAGYNRCKAGKKEKTPRDQKAPCGMTVIMWTGNPRVQNNLGHECTVLEEKCVMLAVNILYLD